MQKDDPVIGGFKSYGLAFDEVVVDIVAHRDVCCVSKLGKCRDSFGFGVGMLNEVKHRDYRDRGLSLCSR